jgi:hypothetical protein
MTKANGSDKAVVEAVRAELRAQEVDFYDPANMEPEQMSIRFLQNWDLEQMSTCDALVAVWTDSTPNSRGVNAEIEWAARLFEIPVYLLRITPVLPEAWPLATAESSGGGMYSSITSILQEIYRGINFARGIRTAASPVDVQRLTGGASNSANERRRQARQRKASARASAVARSGRGRKGS